MKILFVSNWSASHGIAQATVGPLLDLLQKNTMVKEIIYCSVEPSVVPASRKGKVHHMPIPRGNSGGLVLNLKCALAIRKLIAVNHVDLIWCKGSTAGAIGAIVSLITRIPFLVDSFEPHAEYMTEAGLWKKVGLKYKVQVTLERMIRRNAIGLLPVSHAYERELQKGGVSPERIFVVPCIVNKDLFRFDENERESMRLMLGVPDDGVVGVYVGKYGGLYYEEEAFALYKAAFEYWKEKFFLLIITENDNEEIQRWVGRYEMRTDRILVTTAAHSAIPAYLNAADFAFSTIKSNPAMAYCSPIKHGEYWACGLPILSTLQYGDDAEIIANRDGGVLVNIPSSDNKAAFSKIAKMLETKPREHFSLLAEQFRNVGVLESAVKFVLSLPEL